MWNIAGILRSRYIEKWYWGFLLQGAIVLGLAPILIPLIVGGKKGAVEAGFVVAAFYLGQLAAPLLGELADRFRLYKVIYLGSYIVMGVSVLGFVLAEHTMVWLLLALVIGLSAGAGNTLSAMYIVEVVPHEEWDQRIGWLQTFYGSGQALGLFAAAAFAGGADYGMVFAGLLMLPGFLISRVTVPVIKSKIPQQEHRHIPHHFSRRTRSILAPFHYYQVVTRIALRDFGREIYGRFGLLLLSWFLVTLGMWLFMNLYPLLMDKSYGISAGVSATYYAVFATVGAFVYAPSGMLGQKIGNAKVVFTGIVMLFLSLLGLTVLCYIGKAEWWLLVPAAFAMIPIAWSPLIVGGTALASELTPFGQGEGLGLFNGSFALSSVIAAVLAGVIAHSWSYPMVTFAATVFAGSGMLLFVPLLRKKRVSETE